jgi:CheY-like chemotaxis protein
MKDSQVLVAIPSRTIRKLSPCVLGNFGKTLENNAAAVSFNDVSCPPGEKLPDVIFVDDGNITGSFKNYFRRATAEQKHLRIAFHLDSDYSDHRYWEELRMPHQRIAYKSFHRTDADPFYRSLQRFCVCINHSPSSEQYEQTLSELIVRFDVDWELEYRLHSFHEALALPPNAKFPEDVLFLLNPSKFTEQLKGAVAAERIVTSREELMHKLGKPYRLVILSELTWDNRKFSQFYGYEIAREIISKQPGIDLAFISLLPRNQLKSVNAAAQLLVPIFDHYRLPEILNHTDGLLIPSFSSMKWDIIRQYYIRPDGIVDKLVHDIRKIDRHSDKARVIEALHKVDSYALILPAEIIDLAQQVQSSLDEKFEVACKRVREELLPLLEEYYHETVSTHHVDAAKSAYRIMIVEDEKNTLRALEEGLAPYFENVMAFSCGELARKELLRTPRSYSALIVDMELLDGDGNWQSLQGYELIQEANAFPHIVTYLLTGYSKRALSAIKSSLRSKEIGYIAKDPVHGLPPEVDYASFAAKLQSQIQEHLKFLEGPKNGAWRKGLLHFYYSVIASEDGANLWKVIYEGVDRFLEMGGDNEAETIPRELFSVNTKEFDIHHLRAVLIHRLICLHRQYSEKEIQYENDLKKSIGLSLTSPKQYFNSLLGFSGTCLRKNESMHVYRILKKDLFREERAWLKNKFPDDITFRYPRLSEILLDALEYLPRINRNTSFALPKTINSLDDCASMLKVFSTLSTRRREDIASDLEFYISEYHEEFEKLKQDPEGSQVCSYLLELAAAASD